MLAFVFPGQGSQSVGMLAELAARHTVIRDTFSEAAEVLKLDLWAIASAGPEVELNRTENTQPILLSASVAVYRAWCKAGGQVPDFMAGHSLGEYSALVCAESMRFDDALRVVQLRGQAMQRAVPEGSGAMAAILNADLLVIEEACAASSLGDVVAPANLNAPGQIVISGLRSAVERTIEYLATKGVRKAIRLPVSVPSHCALMQPAVLELETALAPIAINAPRVPVLQNVSADSTDDVAALRSNLLAQLSGRVRWIECVQAMAARGATEVLECGPGKALSGMTRRIDSSLQSASLADPADFDAALQRLSVKKATSQNA